MQFKQINSEVFNEQKALDYLELKNYSFQQTLLEDPKIACCLDFTDYLLSYLFQQTIHKKAHERLLVEMFNTDYIFSKLFGLELHKIKEYFVKCGKKRKFSGFELLLLKLIQFQLEEVDNQQKIQLKMEQSHLNNLSHIKIHVLKMMNKTITCLLQNNRKQKLRHYVSQTYKKSIQKIAQLEENQPQIYLLEITFQIHEEIKLDNPDNNYIILDFDFAQNIKEFCLSIIKVINKTQEQNIIIRQMDQLHNNKLVQCEYLLTKIQYLQMLDQWGSVTTNQQLIFLTSKDSSINQSPLAIIRKEDSEKFEQLIVIQDSLLIQTQQYYNFLIFRFIFYEAGQCFYSINFTHKIQKWLIEENEVDYTKAKTIQICKPEYTVQAIGFVEDLFVTYDSSNQIRKVNYIQKNTKNTNHMNIIEINKYQFIIVGNRISSFIIAVRIEEKQLSNKNELEQNNDDFETQMKSTTLLMSQILKNQPQVFNFRVKYQDQIINFGIDQGRQSQLLPKIKLKEAHNYTELLDEFIRDKIQEIEQNIYANKLFQDRILQVTEPFIEHQPDPIDPKILQMLQPLQQGFKKIDHKYNQSEQNASKIQSVRQLQKQLLIPEISSNSQTRKKLDILNFDQYEKSIRMKIDPLLVTDTNFLFKQLEDDYLNVQCKKSTKPNHYVMNPV
ncbi:unnamed protein product [Paramecium sonneborni]|uniref:Uncharacterized protein n=1 Tax=Paramecium sonneborni TaxID=65129 RepID=A0A8S1P5V0_9CILI|nr:unnamed protein product [Paramecium sonneborni]